MGNLLITTNNELTTLKDELTTINNEINRIKDELTKTNNEINIINNKLTTINNEPTTINNEPTIQEQTEFIVILDNFGANRVNVIKEVCAITGLGSKEANDFVDGCPKPVKESISKADALRIKVILENAGAKVSIK